MKKLFNTLLLFIALMVLHSHNALLAQVILPMTGVGEVQTSLTGTLQDHAGGSDYSNSVDGWVTIDVPCGMLLTFEEVNFETCCDWIYIYDGTYNGDGSDVPLLQFNMLSSLGAGGTFTSDGAVTIRMTSDGSVTNTGFTMTWAGLASTPNPNFTVSSANPPANIAVDFITTDSGAATWQWDFGDGSPFNTTDLNPSHSYANAGTYTITFTTYGCTGTEASFQQSLTVQEEPKITVNPASFSNTADYGDAPFTQPLTICNTGDGQLVYSIDEPLISEKGLNMLALINDADAAPTGEYTKTIAAVNTYFNDYVLSSITTYNAAELADALDGKDILLIPEQENYTGWMPALASTIQAFANSGGTVILIGSNQTDNTADCIFDSGMLEGNYIEFATGEMDIVNPTDPILEGIVAPYNAQVVTYIFNITNPDFVPLIQFEGNEVVGYRPIGAGKVVLIGHDYGFSNAQNKRLIANVVANSSQIDNGQFFFLSANEGVLNPGECTVINVEFDAQAVYGGYYQTNLVVNSNDGDAPQTNVPITFDIQGTPTFGISATSVTFGQTMVTDIVTQPLTITNNGTDSLYIVSITSSDPVFSADPASFALYGGGTEQVVDINFAPTAITNYNATITIVTNVGTFTIPISGIGVGAPITTIMPNPLTATVNAGSTATVPLTIANSGEGPLIYSIDNEPFTGNMNVLIYAAGLGAFNNPIPIITSSILTGYPQATISTTTTTNGAALAAALADKKMFVIPQLQDAAVSGLFGGFADELNAFAAQGGVVVVLPGNFDNGAFINSTGLFDITVTGFDNGNAIEVSDETHPLTEDVPAVFFTTNGTSPVTTINADAIVLAQQPVANFGGGGPVAAYRNIGEGKAIYLGFTYTFNDPNAELLLKNAARWTADLSLIDWLTLSDTAGTVGFPSQEVIDVTFDATNLLGGTYVTELNITTNQPFNQNITVPVILTVVGIAQISLSDNNLDFGSVIIGNSETQTITINNPGTDTLFISSIVPSSSAYTVSAGTTAVPPLQSTTLTITYTPTAIQNYNGTITINNNVATAVVNITATGQGAPNASIDPGSVAQTLLSGSQANVTLNLGNSGAGNMAWNVQGAGIIEALVLNYGTTPGDVNNANFLTNVSNYFSGNINLTPYDGSDAASLAAALAGKQLLIVPMQQQFQVSATVLLELGEVMQAFASAGGNIMYAGNSCQPCMQQTGMFGGFFNYSLFGNIGEEITINDPAFGGNLGATVLLPPTTYVWVFDNADLQTIATGPFGGQAMAYRNIGEGSVLYLGTDGSTLGNANLTTLLGNALGWATNALPAWLNITPASGNTAVGANTPLTLNFDADGMLAGVYTYTLLINTNDPDMPVLQVPVTLTVEAFPQAAIGSNATLTCDGYVQFEDQSVNNPTSWSWSFGDGSVSNSQNPLYIYQTEGTYDVSLIACNNLGCDTTTLADYITVDFGFVYCDTTNMPSFSQQTITTCNGVLRDPGGNGQYANGENSTVTITPPGASRVNLNFNFIQVETCCDRVSVYDGPDTSSPLIGQYTADPGVVIESTGPSITVQFTSDGSVIGDGFEALYSCVQITDIPDPNFEYEILSECLGEIEFTDDSDNFPDQWLWNFGDGSPTSTEQNPTHQYAQSGTYDVLLQSCNFLGCDTDTIPVTINNVFFANFTYQNGNPAGPPFINQGTPVLFTSQTVGAVDWTWNFGNGNQVQGSPTANSFYTQQGTYTVTLEVVDAQGCERTATQTIYVVATGLNNNNLDAANLLLQPNPANDHLHLAYQFEGTTAVELRLYDAVGKIALQIPATTATQKYETDLDIADLPQGVYFVALQTDRGIVTKKLTVQ